MRARRGGQPKEPQESMHGVGTAVAEAPAPPINEWGFYNPDLAGFRALISTLDTSEIPPLGNVDENPGDLLSQHKTPSVTTTIEVFPSELALGSDQASLASPAASAVASCRVAHLAPLSLWARVADGDAAARPAVHADRLGVLLAEWKRKVTSRKGQRFVTSDLAGQVGRLTHPALVAMTGLSPACRIRGIRTVSDIAVVEPPDDLPGWLQPGVTPVPDAISIAEPEGPALDSAQAAQAEPEPAVLESDAGAQEDLETVAVAPPALDALQMDFIAAPLTGVEFPTFATASFETGVMPQLELEPSAVEEAPADSFPAIVASGAEEAPAAEAMSVAEAVPMVEATPAGGDEVLAVEAAPAAAAVVLAAPALPVQQPARKRRRTAVALG